MKHFKLFKMLAVLTVLMTSINTAWGADCILYANSSGSKPSGTNSSYTGITATFNGFKDGTYTIGTNDQGFTYNPHRFGGNGSGKNVTIVISAGYQAVITVYGQAGSTNKYMAVKTSDSGASSSDTYNTKLAATGTVYKLQTETLSAGTYYVKSDGDGVALVQLEATVTPVSSGKNIYLKPNGIWNKDGARFAAYYWKSSNESDSGWVDFTSYNACTPCFKATIPSGYDKTILCRMDGSKAANDWVNKWNQTLDLTVPTGNDTLYTISSIDGCTDGKSCGSWGTYATPAYTISFNNGGGTGTMTAISSLACGANQAITANTFERAGYSFANWTADVDVTVGESTITAGSAIADEATLKNITSDITLTAAWRQEVPSSVSISGTTRCFPGQTISLTATPTGGTRDFAYQWQKYKGSAWTDLANGTDDGGTFSGVGTANLQISGCTKSNSGSYRCVVSKLGASVTNGEGYAVHVYTLEGDYSGGSSWTSYDIEYTSGNAGKVDLTLTAGSLFEFGIKDNFNNTWYRNTGFIIDNWTNEGCGSGSGNCRLFTGPAGTYRISVDHSHAFDGSPYVQISVTYPEVTHPAEGYTYFEKPGGWANVKLYWYTDKDTRLTSWEDAPQLTNTATICGKTYYYSPLNSIYSYVIYRDNGSNKWPADGLSTTGCSGKHMDETDYDAPAWASFNTYSITFAANGGSGEMSSINGICPGADQALTANAFTKTGHAFGGWKADVAVTIGGESVSAGTVINDEETLENIAGNITLTAQWNPITYTIAYKDGESDFAGDHESGYPTTHTYGTETTLKSATKTGYTLEGWYTEAGLENKVTSLGATAFTANITLYAKWTANEYTITYMDGESAFAGTHEDGYPTTHTYGTATTLKGATKTGYTLEGWYTEAGLKNKVTSLGATAYTANITLYAKWTAVYTVTFNSNGGSSVASQLVASGETAEEPTDPTRTNWTFGSWQLNGSDYNFSTTVTGNITLYATWSRNSISGGSATEDLVADDLQEAGEENGIPYEGTAFDIVKKDGTVTITKDYSDATHEGDSKTFSYAFLPSNTTAEDKCYKLTANKDISSLVVYYTATDSKFSSKDQSKSGTFTYKKNTGDAVTSTTTDDKSNKIAYKETISSISKGDSVKIYNSANRLAIFAMYATYTADPYTVTITGYAEDGGDSIMNVTSGETLGNLFADGALPTENRDGFDITGWKDASDDSDVTASTVISGTMTIYPDVDIPEYTITLDKGDGDEDGEATVKLLDKALTITTAPSYDDYLLEGYYTTNDKDAVKVADSEGNLIASVTGYTDASGKWIKESDVTLYAQWSAITFCSTFTVNTSKDNALAADDVVVGTGAAEITVVGVGSAESMAYTNRGLQFSASGDSVDVSLPNLIAEGSVIRLEFYWGAASTDKNRGLTLKSTSGTKIQAMTWTPAEAESKKLYYIVKSTDTELIGTNKFRLVREENTVYLASVSLGECGSDVYGVTYKANNSPAEADVSVTYEPTFASNPSFTAPSLKAFAGWNTKDDGTGTHYDVGDAVTEATTVYAEWRYKVLYLGSASESNDVTSALEEKYVLTKRAAKKTFSSGDYTDFALVVLSETLTGGDAATEDHELNKIKSVNKPILNLKSYFYGADNDSTKRWQWAAPNAGRKTTSVYVKNNTYSNLTSHPIYTGLTPDGNDSIQLVKSPVKTVKPIQPLKKFVSGAKGYTLAVVPDGTAIHELTAAQRSALTGETITSKYLLVSLTNGELSNLHDNTKTLLQNAADYLISGEQWVPQYTLTLDDQFGSTAFHVAGDGSKTVTMDANTNLTSTFTKPKREGYIFGGYYTEEDGEGTQIVDENGDVVASASDASYTYTDASKNWKYADHLTVYAKWTDDNVYVFIADVRPEEYGGGRYDFGFWKEDDQWSKGKAPSDIDNHEVILVKQPSVENVSSSTYTACAKNIKIATNGTYTCVDGTEIAVGEYPKLDIDDNGALVVKEYVRNYDLETKTLSPTTSLSLHINAGTARYGSAAGAGGVLIVGNKITDNKAWVEFYTKAHKNVRYDKEKGEYVNDYINQYFGIPFDSTSVYDYEGIYLYAYDAETNSYKAAGNKPVDPFKAYLMLRTEEAGTTLHMTGRLALPGTNPEDDDRLKVLSLYSKEDATASNMFANSWNGPLDIKAMTPTGAGADFVGVEPTFYLYNAGSKYDRDTASTIIGNGSGQWTSLPVGALKADPSSYPQTVIPPQQAFLLVAQSDETSATHTLTLDYYKHVYKPAYDSVKAGSKIEIAPTRAPKRTTTDEALDIIRMRVVGHEKLFNDRVIMYQREDFTDGIDQGWEGRKIIGSAYAPQMYAVSADGKMSINAVPDVEGTVIGFRKGSEDSQYTISFEYNGDKMWYLNDLKEQKSTLISDEETYEFSSLAGDTEARFVISATPLTSPQIATGVDGVDDGAKAKKVVIDQKVYIIRNGRMYDPMGKMVK